MKQDRGLVFFIQRYSVQDGPGLRTTVFIKGCPLKCQWCQNPESWKPYPELMTRDSKCMMFGKCAEVCPVGAVTLNQQEGRTIDSTKCNLCFQCVDACPTGALHKVGEFMAVDEVVAEIERDELFYQRSGGGVTISGGEPLAQWKFVYALLGVCKERHWHTALDTCGYARWPIVEKLLKYVDLVLYDIKHMVPRLHKEGTGKSNRLSTDNLRKIPHRMEIWLRVPLVSGYNDSEDNLRGVAELGREIRAEKISILPFNRVREEKHGQLGRMYTMVVTKPSSAEHLQKVQKFIESFGLKVTIGS